MTTPTPPAAAPTPIIDALCEGRHEPMCGLIWADDVRPLERELAAKDAELSHAKSLIADGDANFSNLCREVEAKDARIAALEKDRALLEEFESLCRCDDVQAHQISEDECEPELLGHYWGTPTVQSCSVREAMKAAIDAAPPNTLTGKSPGGASSQSN